MTTGPVGKVLLRLAFPVFIAQLVFVAFSFFETYFVSQLGTEELAALRYATTIRFFIQILIAGISTGTAVVLAHAIGRGEGGQIQSLMTSCFLLAFLVGVLVCGGVLATLHPIFNWLGVQSDIAPLVAEYLRLWMVGVIFWVVPLLGNGAISATGDTRTASKYTIFMLLLNAVMVPALVVGWGPIRGMGLNGAALANTYSRGIVAVVMLYILAVKYRMIAFRIPKREALLSTWKGVLKVGLPISLMKAIMPVSSGYVTSLTSQFGAEAVAATSITGRLQPLALSSTQALMKSLPGFVGQNFGAGKLGRVKKGMRVLELFAVVWELVMFGLLLVFGPMIIRVFSDDPLVIENAVLFLRMTPPFYGLLSIMVLAATCLNSLKYSTHSTILYVIRMIALNMPLAAVLSDRMGIRGIYLANGLAAGIAGVIALVWLEVIFRKLAAEVRKNRQSAPRAMAESAQRCET